MEQQIKRNKICDRGIILKKRFHHIQGVQFDQGGHSLAGKNFEDPLMSILIEPQAGIVVHFATLLNYCQLIHANGLEYSSPC